MKRYNRLDVLRVATEGFDEGEGYSIWKKAYRAQNNTSNFTGIIRLTFTEKDFLWYIIDSHEENGYGTKDAIEALKYYARA